MNRLIKGLKFFAKVVEWMIRKLSNVLKVSNLHDSTRVGLSVIREAMVNSRETLGIFLNSNNWSLFLSLLYIFIVLLIMFSSLIIVIALFNMSE